MQIPAAAQWSPSFDVNSATQAWLETLSAAQRVQSNAYFEGGYWLLLWNLLWGLAIATWLMSGRRSALAITIVLGSRFIALLYWIVRRAGNIWWAWGAGLVTLSTLFVFVIGPIFIDPLFNEYRPVPAGATRDSILSLARANGIAADDVYVFNASKQTTRISAKVAGALGTARIALNDNLLNNTSLPEIRAVMAHELGHYVLNHVWRQVIYLGLVALIGLLLLHYGFDRALRRWGSRLGVRDRADVAGLPLAVALLSVVGLRATPAVNSIIRGAESEADIFGLNAAREPEAFASVAMRLATYRKLEPGPLEEMLLRPTADSAEIRQHPPAPESLGFKDSARSAR